VFVVLQIKLLLETKDKKSRAIVKDLFGSYGGEDNYKCYSLSTMDFANRKLSWDKMDWRCRLEIPA
jgi:hypothetical protein